MTTLTDLDAPDHDPLAHLDQAGRVALVWDAAAALGERDLSILDLHLRHGLGPGELAEELGTTANNAHQILFTLRKRLGTNVRALVLWRAGRPACDDLRRTLTSAGIATFDKQAVKVIDRHAQVCDECSRERSERLAPAALFGAAPVLAAPFLLKAQAAAALEAAGVPMGGSTALGAGSAGGSAAGGPPTAGGAVPIGGAGTTPADTNPAGLHPDEGAAPAGGPGPSRRRRLLAVAAAVVVLVGTVVVLGGAIDDDEGGTEVAAVLPATSLVGSSASGTGDDLTPTTGAAADTATTAPGGFEVGGGDAPDRTDPDGPSGPTAPPGPGGPPDSGPGATAPPTTVVPPPPTSAPPATTTTTTAPTTTRPPRPVIVTFTAVTFGKQCRGGISWDLAWATADATEVVYGAEGATRQSGPPTGAASVCHPAGTTAPRFLLVASGPGGTAQQLITGASGVR